MEYRESINMKRYLFFAVLFSGILLQGVTFTGAYHRDYGVIDRVVLVFDSAPEYELNTLQNVIFIELPQAKAKSGIALENTGSEHLIQSFAYQPGDTYLTISIAASAIARVSSFHFAQTDVYKLVIDIFTLDTPRTLPEAASFSSFFRTVGYADSASYYEALAVSLPDSLPELPSTEIVQDTTNQVECDTAANAPTTKPYKPQSSLSWIIPSLMIICGGIVFFALWGLTRIKNKRNGFTPSSMRNRDGFAPRELLELMVKDLHAHGWDIQAIADEMQVDIEVIQEILNK